MSFSLARSVGEHAAHCPCKFIREIFPYNKGARRTDVLKIASLEVIRISLFSLKLRSPLTPDRTKKYAPKRKVATAAEEKIDHGEEKHNL